MKTLKGLEKLAIDANPILSAVIGGSARSIFLKAEAISFHITSQNFKEVEYYIPILSDKRHIPEEDLYLALSLLPLVVHDEDFYKDRLKKAQMLIGKCDPDDAPLLALALKLSCPIWSNDKDFEISGLVVYTTLDLIKE